MSDTSDTIHSTNSDIRIESSITDAIRIESDNWACGDSMLEKPFCYETDVTISVNDKVYTVERLREISDVEFDQVRNAVYSFGKVLGPNILSAIDIIERLALDRRIRKLEEKLE